MNEQLLETSGADVLASRKKLRKPRNGVASTPLYVRGLILFLLFLDKNENTREKKQCYESLEKGEPENNEISTLVSYTYTLQVFRFSTLYSRPCCVKKQESPKGDF